VRLRKSCWNCLFWGIFIFK